MTQPSPFFSRTAVFCADDVDGRAVMRALRVRLLHNDRQVAGDTLTGLQYFPVDVRRKCHIGRQMMSYVFVFRLLGIPTFEDPDCRTEER